MKNLVQTAIDAGNFKILVKAIQEAGLIDTLSNDGPFTVFAPNDQAFAKLSKKTVENLFSDKEKLTNILTYHVVLNKVMSKQVINIKNTTTVNGKSLCICTKNGVKIDKANVIITDIKCSNGVIHVIDQVLIPK
jgi:transforming growth factor-beta-induced protein